VHAFESALTSAGITVSVWEPPSWDGVEAADLIVRLVYGTKPLANQEIALRASADERVTLTHYVYDHQLAETGYEGDDFQSREPSADEVEALVTLVRGFCT